MSFNAPILCLFAFGCVFKIKQLNFDRRYQSFSKIGLLFSSLSRLPSNIQQNNL
jgi:hypothetical protein